MGERTTLLEVSDLRKCYANGTVRAVDGVSFAVERGEVVGLLGPNGAGKTTTINCCLGTVTPDSGRVTIDGVDPRTDPRTAHRRVGAVLEGARNVYWRLTVRENLRFFAGLQGIHPDSATDDVERLLSMLNLQGKDDEEVRNLSRGMQQKVAIGCTLVRDTPLVFLDEPTLGLDVEASRALQRELERLVTEEDRAIVLSSHDMDVVRAVCDRVVVLDEGRVVADDAVDELMAAFRTQAYRIRLADPGSARTALAPFDPTWEDDVVEATLPDAESLYDLMSTLRDAGAVVDSVDSVDPDFEEVFLSITGSADADGVDDGHATGSRSDRAPVDGREDGDDRGIREGGVEA